MRLRLYKIDWTICDFASLKYLNSFKRLRLILKFYLVYYNKDFLYELIILTHMDNNVVFQNIHYFFFTHTTFGTDLDCIGGPTI